MAIKGIGSLKSATGASRLQNDLSSALRRLQQTVNRPQSGSAQAPRRTSGGAGDKVTPTKNSGFGTYSATKSSNQASSRSAASGSSSRSSTSSGAPRQTTNTSSLGGTSTAQRQQMANQVAASSGGTAPGTTLPPGSTTPGANGTEGNATSPFGQSFTPDSHQEMFKNPEAMIRAWYEFNKLGTNGGEMAMSQQANARNMMLYHTMFGANNGTFGGNNSQFGPYSDFVNQHLQRGRTPGAGYYSQDQIMDRLYTTDKNDPIYTQLNAEGLTPGNQANNFISAYATAMGPSAIPEMLGVHLARLGELEQAFIAQKAQGQHAGMNFGQYLQANGWGG